MWERERTQDDADVDSTICSPHLSYDFLRITLGIRMMLIDDTTDITYVIITGTRLVKF